MNIKVITPPNDLTTVSLAEARLQCKVDPDDTSHDAALTGLITAAREYAEHRTQTAIGSQTLELALDEFPGTADAIELRHGPVGSISSVKYIDEDGVEQTLSTSNYTLDDYSSPAWLLAAYDTEWPETRDTANAVKVRYVAGATVPKAVKSAMLLHIELESPLNPHTTQERQDLERARDSLLDTVKVYGF